MINEQGSIMILHRYCFCLLVLFSVLLHAAPLDTFSHYTNQHGLPQNSVNCMVEDKHGFLWLGTQGGLSRFDGYEFVNYYRQTPYHNLPANWISHCIKDQQSELWFTTTTDGVALYNDKTDSFTAFNTKLQTDWPDDKIWSASVVQTNLILFGSESGYLILLDINTKQFQKIQLNKSAAIKDIYVHNDTAWLATTQGIASYTFATDELNYHPALNAKLTNHNLTAITVTKNTLWLGSRKGLQQVPISQRKEKLETELIDVLSSVWVYRFYQTNKRFFVLTYGKGAFEVDQFGKLIKQFQHFDKATGSLQSNYLLSAYFDTNKNLYFGTDGKGVSIKSELSNAFSHHKKLSDTNDLSHNFTRAITTINSDLWVATRNGLNRSTDNGKTFISYLHKSGDNNSLPNNNVFALLNHNDVLWAGTYGGGLTKFDRDKNQFISYTEQDGLSSNYVYTLTHHTDSRFIWLGGNNGVNLFDVTSNQVIQKFNTETEFGKLSNNTIFDLVHTKDHLWVATRNGLNEVNLLTGEVNVINKDTNPLYGITGNWITALHQDNQSNLWVGTLDGLNQITPQGDISHYDLSQGLSNNNVFAIQEIDNELWISTNKGINVLNLEQLAFRSYAKSHGLQDNAFLLGSSHKAQQKLYFGGVNGFNIINPRLVQSTELLKPVVLTHLKVANETAKLSSGSSLITQALPYMPKLNLSHEQDAIEFGFSALHIGIANHLEYAYQLAGFDNEWQKTSHSKRYANYTNLPSGQYTFQLKYRTRNGNWSDVYQVASVKLNPAPWLTWWAFLIYASLVALITWRFMTLKINQTRAEQKRIAAEDLACAKEQMLATISHEFKTPLTLIVAPLQELKNSPLTANQKQLTTLASQQAEQLSQLVDQAVNVSEFNHYSELPKSAQNLSHQLTTTLHAFANEIAKKDIQVKMNITPDITLLLAKTTAASLISNVLSNAIKYCDKQGHINVVLNRNKDNILLQVSNSTQSIDQQQLALATEKFTRFNESESGTGLGLFLVNRIVSHHQGDISLHCENDVFTISITLPASIELETIPAFISDIEKPGTQQANIDARILIVEDNVSLNNYLASALGEFFQIDTALNGLEAIQKIEAKKPDLILSDLTMPLSGGLNLLKQIRETDEWDYIPFVLMTASDTNQTKKQAFEHLVDDFIAKPFTIDILHTRLDNLIKLRRNLAKQTKLSFEHSTAAQASNENHDPWLTSLHNAITKFALNDGFNSEQLADKLSMSSRNLQIKTKKYCAMSPNELIRSYRIQTAKNLLETTSMELSDIASQVGFGSASYFSKCFKDESNMSPRKYRKSLNNNKVNR